MHLGEKGHPTWDHTYQTKNLCAPTVKCVMGGGGGPLGEGVVGVTFPQ